MVASLSATSNQLPVVFLMGPTASGKTAAAAHVYDNAKSKFGRGVELINVDSTQVYKGMDIGSAKMTAEELKQYPHHLIDIREPHQPYSAADFRQDALGLINDIHARDNIPLFVGGTMMYYKVLRDGLADLPQADDVIRQQILDLATEKGWPHIHALLNKVDPESGKRLEPNDSQRLQRAYEVFLVSGKTITQCYQEQKEKQESDFNYRLLQLALYPEIRADLHNKIALRFEQMIEKGFVEEVERLRQDKRLHKGLPAMRAAGYRQFWDYLDGETTLDEAKELGIIATRQLAKRQLTWVRNWDNVKLLSFSFDGVGHKVLETISELSDNDY